MSGFLGKIVGNVYAESQARATEGVNLYGGREVSEHEVLQAYAEAIEITIGFNTGVRLIAESCEVGLNHLNDLGKVMYGEAEGGFFKRILDALIKVYNKVKNFFVTLFGKVKSDKKYREELANIQSIAKSLEGKKFPDTATITINKTRYGSLTAIIARILMKGDNVVFGATFGEGKLTMEKVASEAKKVIETLAKYENEDSDKIIGNDIQRSSSSIGKLMSALDDVRQTYPNTEMWLRAGVYGKAITDYKSDAFDTAQMGFGSANFGKNSNQSPTEAIGNLWSTETINHKGDAIVTKVINGFFVPFANGMKYDALSEAIEDGVKNIEEITGSLQDAVKELEKDASRVQTSTNSSDKIKKVASSAANIATTYSTVLNDFSTVALTSFNTAKVQLDRILADMKTIGNKLDTLRKEKAM